MTITIAALTALAVLALLTSSPSPSSKTVQSAVTTTAAHGAVVDDAVLPVGL
ncbi:MAG TPA: hypothetical protein VFE35_00890 [Candidatus Cybelea sp.]|jgi:hypothetical protein|nr:hypothetical protein [Candidatus Cybelea sp.]